MNVVRATPSHVIEAIAWAERRGIGRMPEDMFSSCGFVVEGMAAVWLYLTDSSLAYGEMLVSNPDAPKKKRRAAMALVVAAVIAEAKAAGCRTVLAPCLRDDVGMLLLQNGFQSVGTGLTLYAANLGKD